MPTYEYLCQACSHRFETWQKMTDEPLTICPECGGHIRRVLYPAGIVFKGHGFYKTDHGNGAIPPSNGKTEKTEGAASEAAGNGESKPAANGANGTGSTSAAAGDKSSAASVK